MTGSSSETLPAFLRSVRSGGAPVAPLDCGRAKAFFHPAACSSVQAGELARIANRPLPGLTLYKFGSRSIVGSFFLSDGLPVVLKYYYPSSTAKHIVYDIRGSRCLRSWSAALAFLQLGIPTPAPLVIAEWQLLRGLWLSKSFLATRRAEGIPLDEFITRHGLDDPRLEQTVASLQRSFSIMARHRAVHGDLKASNLFVSPSGEVSFIDLDAAECLLPEAVWRSRREKDRSRFFKNWRKTPGAADLFARVFDF